MSSPISSAVQSFGCASSLLPISPHPSAPSDAQMFSGRMQASGLTQPSVKTM